MTPGAGPLEFSLKPFRAGGHPAGLAVCGSIARRAGTLAVEYELRGPLPELAVPARAEAAERRDGLWEETCLELFLGIAGAAGYWEFNLSPAGHWNVYRFASYRESMRPEGAFASLPFAVRRGAGTLRVSLEVDIGAILPAGGAIDFAACAVVRTKAGNVSYWALDHPGPRPDFHRRDGFSPLP